MWFFGGGGYNEPESPATLIRINWYLKDEDLNYEHGKPKKNHLFCAQQKPICLRLSHNNMEVIQIK